MDLCKLLASLIPELKDGALMDAGANIGLYTLLLRSATDRPIIAYEPQPFLFKLLQWNLAYNRIENVDARNTACGSKNSTIAFNIGINGAVLLRSIASAAPSTRLKIKPSL